ncbi:MAG TPA: hypothetical protein VGL94_00480 [Ktedonobacteraceae bacterium]|jgi:hypothetical protein
MAKHQPRLNACSLRIEMSMEGDGALQLGKKRGRKIEPWENLLVGIDILPHFSSG